MPDFVQLDLFGDRPAADRPKDGASVASVAPERLCDGELIAAIPDATLADAVALTTEAGKRRLIAAIPALVALCNRFVGYGASAVAPEQVGALHALGAIGGPQAANAVSRLIVKKIVQGPTLSTALTVAAQLAVVLPSDVAVGLLRDPDPSVRAAACGCVRSGAEVIAALLSLANDPDSEVAVASACALGGFGRKEALERLKRYLAERPSHRVVEALTRVADEEAIVRLARTGRTRRELICSVIAALEDMETPRASAAADALKRFAQQTEPHLLPGSADVTQGSGDEHEDSVGKRGGLHGSQMQS